MFIGSMSIVVVLVRAMIKAYERMWTTNNKGGKISDEDLETIANIITSTVKRQDYRITKRLQRARQSTEESEILPPSAVSEDEFNRAVEQLDLPIEKNDVDRLFDIYKNLQEGGNYEQSA